MQPAPIATKTTVLTPGPLTSRDARDTPWSWGRGPVVLLSPRVRRRHLLHRYHEGTRSTALHAQPRSSLEVYPRPTSGDLGLRRATSRPVVGESPRDCREEDVESREARARPLCQAALAYREVLRADPGRPYAA